MMQDNHQSAKTYFYFVGDDRYESESETITGAQIKAKIPNLAPGTGLSLEGHGNDPDQMIADDQSVSLEVGHGEGGPRRFTLVPPATFG